MPDLTEHFSRREFRCKCAEQGKRVEDGYCGGQFDAVDHDLLFTLEYYVHAHFSAKYGRVRVDISSACRCEKHNADEGGADLSSHKMGKAADFTVTVVRTDQQVHPDEVADYLESKFPNSCGIGRYSKFTHFDTRSYKARWDAR